MTYLTKDLWHLLVTASIKLSRRNFFTTNLVPTTISEGLASGHNYHLFLISLQHHFFKKSIVDLVS